jgi:signal transduction histidine kinase
VSVELRVADERVVLEVADDGVGFDPHRSYPGHLGLTSMRERAAVIGGQVEITSAPGAGTHTLVAIPLAS